MKLQMSDLDVLLLAPSPDETIESQSHPIDLNERLE